VSGLESHAAFMAQSWGTLVQAFPPVDAAAETAAFERWAQDTAAALMREDPSLKTVPGKAFWSALIEAAATSGLSEATAASLRRRAALL
jgi:hypothetical protein